MKMESKPVIFSTAKREHDENITAENAIKNSIVKKTKIESSRPITRSITNNSNKQPLHIRSNKGEDLILEAVTSSDTLVAAGVKRPLLESESEPIRNGEASNLYTNENESNTEKRSQTILHPQKKAKKKAAQLLCEQGQAEMKLCRKKETIDRINTESPYELSSEQLDILQTIRSPKTGGSIIRITAAAGTGKTETLLKLAQVAEGLGHEFITYLTFNKAAAKDAEHRIKSAFQNSPNQTRMKINAQTIHACAMSQMDKWRESSVVAATQETGRFLGGSANELMKLIQNLCEDEIEHFLARYRQNISSGKFYSKDKNGNANTNIEGMMKSARKKVCYYLMKTLLSNLCASKLSYDEFCNPKTRNRVYYPAVLYHKGNGVKHGYEGYHLESKYRWYADTAAKLWKKLEEKGLQSYDLEMKRAQLLNLQVPGSCLFVDESQDCNACQIAWLAKQAKFGCQVYFVGDAAQTIYSFRGAKSKFLMELETKQSCTLTRSWRFGPSIGRMANLVLFAKEYSPQTTGNKIPIWEPYRVKGHGTPNDAVTSMPISMDWKSQKVTIIARSNAKLLSEAMNLLGFKPKDTETEEDCNGLDLPLVTQSPDSHVVPLNADKIQVDLPKIHINGGKGSGPAKFRSVISEVEALFDLYMDSDAAADEKRMDPDDLPTNTPMVLDSKIFTEFEGEAVTWKDFNERVVDQELGKYIATLGVIRNYGSETLRALELFKSMVLDAKYDAHEADVILTTAHAAKGQEWDNVQVCDDFQKLKVSDPSEHSKKYCLRTNQQRAQCQFSSKSYGDDLNLLYVAVTRSKKLLSVPNYLKRLLCECDAMSSWISSYEGVIEAEAESNLSENDGENEESLDADPPDFSEMKNVTIQKAFAVFDDIIAQLRKENDIEQDARIVPLFFNGDEGG